MWAGDGGSLRQTSDGPGISTALHSLLTMRAGSSSVTTRRRRVFVVEIRKDLASRGCPAFEWRKPAKKTPSVNVILDKATAGDMPEETSQV